jgi:putative transposase
VGVQIPRGVPSKYRRKVLCGELRQYLGDVFCKLALQKESRIEQVHLMPDHVQTAGRDEAAIREYIKNQQQEDKRLDQLNLWR